MIGRFTWYNFKIVFFAWLTCWFLSGHASSIGTFRGYAREVAFIKISDRDLNAYLCPFASVSSWTEGAKFFSAQIKYCAAWMIEFVDYIFGMLNFLGRNATVSEIILRSCFGDVYLMEYVLIH